MLVDEQSETVPPDAGDDPATAARRAVRRRRILVVAGNAGLAETVGRASAGAAVDVAHAASAADGMRRIHRWSPDVILLDHPLPDRSGLDLLGEIIAIDRHVPVLFTTADDAAYTAIEAVRRGAFDCLAHPVSRARLERDIAHALEIRRLLKVPVVLDGAAEGGTPEAYQLVGRCEAMRSVYKAMGRNAAHRLPLLISGEAGTGKESVARAIHRHSSRSGRPWLAVRCENYDARRLEPVLFGTAGAPEADGDVGLVAQARGGTLLLEELAAIPPAVQTRLVDQILRSGRGTGPACRDVAFVFTTVHAPSTLVDQHHVRSDLYYELSGNTIHLPPLRERGDDLRLLVEHFVRRLARIGRSFDALPRVSDEAMRLFGDYAWPGNITELQSVLRRALLESGGTILAGDYLRATLRRGSASASAAVADASAADSSAPRAAAPVDWREFVRRGATGGTGDLYAQAVESLERGLVTEILRHTEGNLAQAARQLGITRVSLRKKIQTLGIAIPGRE